jgi:hypothetical protein
MVLALQFLYLLVVLATIHSGDFFRPGCYPAGLLHAIDGRIARIRSAVALCPGHRAGGSCYVNSFRFVSFVSDDDDYQYFLLAAGDGR